MDDDAENRLLVDAFYAHVRLASQATQNVWNRCSFVLYVKNLFRVYLLRNECIVAFAVILAVMLLLQYGNLFSRLFGRKLVVLFPQSGIRLPAGSDYRSSVSSTTRSAARSAAEAFRAAAKSFVLPPEKENIVIQERGSFAAAYAVQGRRPTMEDRFILRENIGGTGVHLFAVFDGHGGVVSIRGLN
jgi:protein phosphatase 1L